MVVFVVLAHGDPTHAARLVDRLQPHPVVMHVDSKVETDAFAGLPRTTYVRDRVDVHWLGFSTVEAQARSLETAVRLGDPEDHVVMLSGSCYPTRPLSEFERWLRRAPGRQHCEAALLLEGAGSSAAGRRLTRRWLFDSLPARQTGARYWINGAVRRSLALALPRLGPRHFAPLRPVAGSAHFAITLDCASSLLSRYRSDPVVRRFRHAASPDEMVFHSLLHDDGRWSAQTQQGGPVPRAGRLTSSFASFHHLDPLLQGYRTLEDLPAITASGRFFTRKVSTALSSDLLDVLDRRL
jgi:hypothetical protein